MTESKNYSKNIDKCKSLMGELHKILGEYFCRNIPSKKESAIIKQYIPDLITPEYTLQAIPSRLFRPHGQPGLTITIGFLKQINSCHQYIDLLDTIYQFGLDGKSQTTPQGDLKKSLLNLLIKELNISEDSYQPKSNNAILNPQLSIINLPFSGTITIPTILESAENKTWSKKLAALEIPMNNIQSMREATEAKIVLFKETQFSTNIIELTADYLKPDI